MLLQLGPCLSKGDPERNRSCNPNYQPRRRIVPQAHPETERGQNDDKGEQPLRPHKERSEESSGQYGSKKEAQMRVYCPESNHKTEQNRTADGSKAVREAAGRDPCAERFYSSPPSLLVIDRTASRSTPNAEPSTVEAC